jgi:ferritin light chain
MRAPLDLLKFQYDHRGHLPFQDDWKSSKDEYGKTREAVDTVMALENNLNQTFLDLHAWNSALTDPQLCDFLENHFLHKMMDDHMTKLYRMPRPQAFSSLDQLVSDVISKLTSH